MFSISFKNRKIFITCISEDKVLINLAQINPMGTTNPLGVVVPSIYIKWSYNMDTQNITKQNLLICFTYLLGKAGLLSNIDTDACELVFEAETDISDRREVNLRKEYYKKLTKQALNIKTPSSKKVFQSKLNKATDQFLLEIANRQPVLLPLTGICSPQGIKSLEFLIEHGYQCKNILNNSKYGISKKFAFGELSNVTLFEKFDAAKKMSTKLRFLLGEATDFTVVSTVLLDKGLTDWLSGKDKDLYNEKHVLS